MSVRSTKVQIVTVNGGGAPLANQQVQATLIVPGTASPVDLNSERIDLTPLSATSDNTGTATFDPAASPTNGLIAPQDVQQYVSGVLVPLPGCYWQLSYSSTQIFSPNYAYTASIINAATWTSIPSTLGLIKCYLTDVYGSGLAIANRTFSVALSGDAFWTGGAGLGQRVPGNAGFPAISNGSGTLTAYVIRQTDLNPATGAYIVTDTVNGGTVVFQAPTTYGAQDKGVYNAGTTYALNDIVRRAADDEPFISLTNSNVGNALTDAVHWSDYAGINIESIMTALAPPSQVALTQGGIGADTSVATGSYTNPPATLQDQLRQLTQIKARHVTASTDTATYDDDVLDLDGTSNTVTETLPTAVGWTKFLLVKCINAAHTVTLAGGGGQTIDGSASVVLALNVAYLIYSDGANWRIGATANLGGASLEVTDGTHDNTSVTKITIAAPGQVGGTSSNTTITYPPMGASGGGHTSGLVPDPGSTAGTTRFLREDATWATTPATTDATTTTTGVVEIDQAPPAGHPRALTTPRLGAASGVALLGGDGTVPSANLPTTIGALTEFGRWTRAGSGALISPTQAWETTWVDEPTVLIDLGKYRMWYGGGTTNRGVGYADCLLTADPTNPANWTKHTGPVWGQGGSGFAGYAAQNCVVKYQGTYYLYYADGATNLKIATSPDGIAWTAAGTALTGGSPSWASSQWANPAVWVDPITGTWHMLIEANNGTIWQIGHATAPDGLAWTVVAGPFTAMQVAAGGAYGGPWVTQPSQKYGNNYEVWYHAASTSGDLPTNIYRASSPDLITWTQTGEVLQHLGTNFEIDQVADPSVVEANGSSYLFFSANDNTGIVGRIKIAVFAGTVAQLVAGQAAGGGGGNLSVLHNAVAVGTRPAINLIDSSSIAATVTDNGVSNEVDISFSTIGGFHYEPVVIGSAGATAPTFVVNDQGQCVMVQVPN